MTEHTDTYPIHNNDGINNTLTSVKQPYLLAMTHLEYQSRNIEPQDMQYLRRLKWAVQCKTIWLIQSTNGGRCIDTLLSLLLK